LGAGRAPEGVLPEKLVWGVWPASQNPYPIKLLFSGFLPFKGDFVCRQKKRQNTVTELLLNVV